MTEVTKKTVAVDLDGVLAEYDGWKGSEHFGDPIPGAAKFLNDLREFARVLIWTTRVNYPGGPERVRAWLRRHAMPYDDLWLNIGKPLAAAFVDDRAVNPLMATTRCLSLSEEWDRSLRQCRQFCEDGKVNGEQPRGRPAVTDAPGRRVD